MTRLGAATLSLFVFVACAREAFAPNGNAPTNDGGRAKALNPAPVASAPRRPTESSATATPPPTANDANAVTDFTAASGTTLPGTVGTATPKPPAEPAAPEVSFSAHYPLERAVRLLAWKREHHVRGPGFDQECWELGEHVGTPPAPGLLCRVVNRKPLFTLGRIYRLEGGRLREVWQATLATYANWLELTPLLADDGTLVLHDHRPGSCETALREYQAKQSAQVAPPSGELLGPACAKRGRYAYEQGKDRLVEHVSPGL